VRVLYLSHTGLTEPLGRSQILPYVLALARHGWEITLLSFEKPETATPEAVTRTEADLASAGLLWVRFPYRRGATLLHRPLDLVSAFFGASRVQSVGLVHARSTLPGVVAAALARRLHVPWLFDLRGLLAQEYVDAGHWSQQGFLSRITQAVEIRLLGDADGVVTLTRRLEREIKSAGLLSENTPIEVIPCSVDLRAFHPEREARARVRQDLGLGGEPLLVYSGSLGSWYRPEEMLDFFQIAQRRISGLRFLFLTPQVTLANTLVRRRSLEREALVRSADPGEVPAYLAAADAAICFLAPVPSKRASSPTKYGEYLATGLPVVLDSWTGDVNLIAHSEAVITVNGFQDAEFVAAADTLAQRMRDPEATSRAARALAVREFRLEDAVERYDRMYRVLTGRRPDGAPSCPGLSTAGHTKEPAQ